MTFTEQHTREDRFGELLSDIKQGYRQLKSGRWWIEFAKRYQLGGSIESTEPMVSKAAGWHPHIHATFFSKIPADKFPLEEFEREISEKFISVMGKRGRYVSAIYGVHADKACDPQAEDDQALKKYVAKWGLDAEIAKGPVKSGKVVNGVEHYSPFQLLELADTGDKWAAAMYQEYAKVMKGRKQLVWSRGLRAVLGLVKAEKSDEELAQEKISAGDVLLARLTLYQWRVVLANDARVELLEKADTGSVEAVEDFLQALGAIERSEYPPGATNPLQTPTTA